MAESEGFVRRQIDIGEQRAGQWKILSAAIGVLEDRAPLVRESFAVAALRARESLGQTCVGESAQAGIAGREGAVKVTDGPGNGKLESGNGQYRPIVGSSRPHDKPRRDLPALCEESVGTMGAMESDSESIRFLLR